MGLRSKRPKRNRVAAYWLERLLVGCPIRAGTMNFVADILSDERKIRFLTIGDNFSRLCLTIQVGKSLKGKDVAAVITHLQQEPGMVPKRI